MKRLRFAIYLLLFTICNINQAEAMIDESTVRTAWIKVCAAAEVEPLPLFIEDNETLNAACWIGDQDLPEEDPKSQPHVTVNTGLMKVLQNEDHIFGILAHELGHYVYRHVETINSYTEEELNVFADMMSISLGGSVAAHNLAFAAGELRQKEYSRVQELEADVFAIDLTIKARRNPMAGLYSSFEQMIAAEGLMQFDEESTHPSNFYRLEAMRRRIRAHESALLREPAADDADEIVDLASLESAVAEQRALLEQQKIKLEESKKFLEDLREKNKTVSEDVSQ